MSVAHKFGETARTDDVIIGESVDFAGLLLSDPVLHGLKNAGFERPSPIQLKAIPLGRCGLDLIVQAKSGTGKTCVFAVIALESIQVKAASTQVLVLAPTREIAIQIWEVIGSLGSAMPGLKCHTFIGGLPLHEDKKKLQRCHIAVGTPGRIQNLLEVGCLKSESIRLFILDEADKLLEESFQEQVNWIYSALPENKQMLALSATYPEYLAQHMTVYMRNPTFIRLNITDPTLLGIKQYYTIVLSHPLPHKVFEAKTAAVIRLLSSVSFHQCLIFSNMQSKAQNLEIELTSHGWPTTCIAGCLDQKDRIVAMAKLKSYQCRVLVSTDLTSRGIDAEKVNLVINLDVPKDYETYLHRIGRAGRFGSYGAAVTIVSEDQELLDMQNIERNISTQIQSLPDPIPSDLVKRQLPVKLDDLVITEQLITRGQQNGSMPSPPGLKPKQVVNKPAVDSPFAVLTHNDASEHLNPLSENNVGGVNDHTAEVVKGPSECKELKKSQVLDECSDLVGETLTASKWEKDAKEEKLSRDGTSRVGVEVQHFAVDEQTLSNSGAIAAETPTGPVAASELASSISHGADDSVETNSGETPQNGMDMQSTESAENSMSTGTSMLKDDGAEGQVNMDSVQQRVSYSSLEGNMETVKQDVKEVKDNLPETSAKLESSGREEVPSIQASSPETLSAMCGEDEERSSNALQVQNGVNSHNGDGDNSLPVKESDEPPVQESEDRCDEVNRHTSPAAAPFEMSEKCEQHAKTDVEESGVSDHAAMAEVREGKSESVSDTTTRAAFSADMASTSCAEAQNRQQREPAQKGEPALMEEPAQKGESAQMGEPAQKGEPAPQHQMEQKKAADKMSKVKSTADLWSQMLTGEGFGQEPALSSRHTPPPGSDLANGGGLYNLKRPSTRGGKGKKKTELSWEDELAQYASQRKQQLEPAKKEEAAGSKAPTAESDISNRPKARARRRFGNDNILYSEEKTVADSLYVKDEISHRDSQLPASSDLSSVVSDVRPSLLNGQAELDDVESKEKSESVIRRVQTQVEKDPKPDQGIEKTGGLRSCRARQHKIKTENQQRDMEGVLSKKQTKRWQVSSTIDTAEFGQRLVLDPDVFKLVSRPGMRGFARGAPTAEHADYTQNSGITDTQAMRGSAREACVREHGDYTQDSGITKSEATRGFARETHMTGHAKSGLTKVKAKRGTAREADVIEHADVTQASCTTKASVSVEQSATRNNKFQDVKNVKILQVADPSNFEFPQISGALKKNHNVKPVTYSAILSDYEQFLENSAPSVPLSASDIVQKIFRDPQSAPEQHDLKLIDDFLDHFHQQLNQKMRHSGGASEQKEQLSAESTVEERKEVQTESMRLPESALGHSGEAVAADQSISDDHVSSTIGESGVSVKAEPLKSRSQEDRPDYAKEKASHLDIFMGDKAREADQQRRMKADASGPRHSTVLQKRGTSRASQTSADGSVGDAVQQSGAPSQKAEGPQRKTALKGLFESTSDTSSPSSSESDKGDSSPAESEEKDIVFFRNNYAEESSLGQRRKKKVKSQASSDRRKQAQSKVSDQRRHPVIKEGRTRTGQKYAEKCGQHSGSTLVESDTEENTAGPWVWDAWYPEKEDALGKSSTKTADGGKSQSDHRATSKPRAHPWWYSYPAQYHPQYPYAYSPSHGWYWPATTEYCPWWGYPWQQGQHYLQHQHPSFHPPHGGQGWQHQWMRGAAHQRDLPSQASRSWSQTAKAGRLQDYIHQMASFYKDFAGQKH